jgi:hypothetical protein
MPRSTLYAKALQRAQTLLGGPWQLQMFLRVPSSELAAWMSGESDPPLPVFLRVVDLLLDGDRAAGRQTPVIPGSVDSPSQAAARQ